MEQNKDSPERGGMENIKTSQDAFMSSSLFYSANCVGYFTKFFYRNGYDLQKLRIALDEFSFQSSCTFDSLSESNRHLGRSERCDILLEALGPKQEVNLSDSFFGIIIGLFGSIYGASASPAPSRALPFTLLAVGAITLLYYFYRFFTISAQNKLREALVIIKMESKSDETSNTAAQS